MKTFRIAAITGFVLAGSAALAQDAKPAPEAEKKPEPQITVRGATTEAATKEVLRGDALLARCVIKPVMTDEEINLCKAAYRQSR